MTVALHFFLMAWRLLIIKWDAEQRSLTYDLEGVGRSFLGLYLILIRASLVLQKQIGVYFNRYFFQEAAVAVTRLHRMSAHQQLM